MKRDVLYISGLLAAIPSWIFPESTSTNWHPYHHHMMGGSWGMGGIFMFMFWILIFLAIVAFAGIFIRQQKGPEPGSEKSALDILNERYARGEIGKEEYEEKKKDIG